MGDIIESIDVEAPLTTTYNQWTQFEEFPRFMSGVEQVTQQTDTMTHWVVRVGGATREFDAVITEQQPDERVAWQSTQGPRHAGVVGFERLDDTHTRVTAKIGTDPEGFIEAVGDKVGLLDMQVKSDLKRFKQFIEERGRETGGWRGEVPRPGSGPAQP